jgi:hypothetical protein
MPNFSSKKHSELIAFLPALKHSDFPSPLNPMKQFHAPGENSQITSKKKVGRILAC